MAAFWKRGAFTFIRFRPDYRKGTVDLTIRLDARKLTAMRQATLMEWASEAGEDVGKEMARALSRLDASGILGRKSK